MAVRPIFFLLPLAAALGAPLACTHTETKEVDDPVAGDDDDDAGSAPPPDSGLGILTFRPSELYSGFDGKNTFKVPFAVYDHGDDVAVTASPASAVTITPKTLTNPVGPNGTDLGKYYFAEVKAAGDVTFTVKSKGRTATGILHVVTYDPARYAAGEARYKTGVDKAHPACTDCHVNGQAIDHSPSALASVTDEKVGLIMSTGLSANNFPIQVDRSLYPSGHKWTSGAGAEQDGLITYLRALEPKGFK